MMKEWCNNMMEAAYKDEWIKGPFCNATIEGFIVSETENNFGIVVHKILEVYDNLPASKQLKPGMVQLVPKEHVDELFMRHNKYQQESLIEIANIIGEHEWALELKERYYNPYRAGTIEFMMEKSQGIQIYSEMLDFHLKIEDEEREELFRYYQKAVDRGLSKRFNDPKEINNSTAVDLAISYIVCASGEDEGIDYVKQLIRRGKWLK